MSNMNQGFEIERKFKVISFDTDLSQFEKHSIEQAYLNRVPVLRIRKKDDSYYFTFKAGGMKMRTESEVELSELEYKNLRSKIEGRIIKKTRYIIPHEGYKIELDLFENHPENLIMAEVEFPSLEEADALNCQTFFGKLGWQVEDVTDNPAYHNVNMAYGLF